MDLDAQMRIRVELVQVQLGQVRLEKGENIVDQTVEQTANLDPFLGENEKSDILRLAQYILLHHTPVTRYNKQLCSHFLPHQPRETGVK